jgi:hypothetical protein
MGGAPAGDYAPPAIAARRTVGGLLYGSDPLLVPSAHFAP